MRRPDAKSRKSGVWVRTKFAKIFRFRSDGLYQSPGLSRVVLINLLQTHVAQRNSSFM